MGGGKEEGKEEEKKEDRDGGKMEPEGLVVRVSWQIQLPFYILLYL